ATELRLEPAEEGVPPLAKGLPKTLHSADVVARDRVLGDRESRELARAAARVQEARQGDPLDDRGVGREVADAEAGCDRLGEAAEADDGTWGADRPQGIGRSTVVGQ